MNLSHNEVRAKGDGAVQLPQSPALSAVETTPNSQELIQKSETKLPALRVLRLCEVLDLVSISRATHFAKLDEKSKSYDPTYPKPVSLGKRTVRYVEQEVLEWLTSRMEAR